MLEKEHVEAIEDAMERLRGRDVTFDFRPDGTVWALYAGPDGRESAEIIVTRELSH